MAKSNDVVGKLEEINAKLPALPKSATDLLVTVTPWIALIFGVLGVLASLAAIGLMAALSPLMVLGSGVGQTGSGIITGVLGLISSALLLAAFPGTKSRKMQGWTLLFWSEVVSVISSVVLVSVSGVLFALIGFYLLFQIKSNYR